jgi:AraC family transcriptional regulator
MKVIVAHSAESSHTTATNSSVAADSPFHYLAKGLATLLETAQRELDNDRVEARASLVAASSLLKSEIDRTSGAHDLGSGALAIWQITRVREFIEANLHNNIYVTDLCAVARRSPAYFSRSFKKTFGDAPHTYLTKRRLERACHLMVTTSEPLTCIALSAGFCDQSHFCRVFQRAFGKSPSNWRRHHTV